MVPIPLYTSIPGHPQNVGVFYFKADILTVNWRSPKRADVGSNPTPLVKECRQYDITKINWWLLWSTNSYCCSVNDCWYHHSGISR